MSSAFTDKSTPPSDTSLSATLSAARAAWDAILDSLEAGLTREWKHYGAKYGWQLKVSRRKKAVLYLVPHAGSFLAAMALGEQAVAALPDSGLPEPLIREIQAARKAPEGRPARVEVATPEEAAHVQRLLALARPA